MLAPFPFTDLTTAKQRPAVIISSIAYNANRPDVILMPVSSRPGPAGTVGGVTIVQWQVAKLLHPSVIKPIIATLEYTLIRRQLGQLQLSDQQ